MAALAPRLVVASLAAASALGACAVGEGAAKQVVFGLPRVEQAALADCRGVVHARLCGARADGDACWEEVSARYTALRDTVERKRFLVDSGCPSPRVEAWLPDPR